MNKKKQLNNDFILEVCTNGLSSGINAIKGGTNRIELCSSLFEGGTTPSPALIEWASEIINLESRVMIRPRGGDFLYSDLEFEIMKKEIEYCKKMKIDGVVFGLLLPNGTIDYFRTKALIEIARPMKVTFHRAFDMCENIFSALDTLIQLKVDTVLTSGGKNKAIEGIDNLKKLVLQADNKIEIMAGSGVRPHNVELLYQIGIRSFHLSGLTTIPSKMEYRKPNISMGNLQQIPEFDISITDTNTIQLIKTKLAEYSLLT